MVTAFLASVLGLLFFKVSYAVIQKRLSLKVPLGTENNETILGYTSAHSNFSQYAPMLLILFYLCEQANFLPRIVLVIMAIAIITGRIFHFRALTNKKQIFKLRVRGMQLTLIPLMIMSISLIVAEALKLIN